MEIQNIRIKCECGHSAIYKMNDVDFSWWEEECRLCGSHSECTVDFTCKSCGKTKTVDIGGW